MKHREKQQLLLFFFGITAGILVSGLGGAFLTSSPIPLPTKNPSDDVVPQILGGALPEAGSPVGAYSPAIVAGSPPNRELVSRALSVERELVAAVKSCLGSKCIDERPKGAARDRVLVTALPGSGGETLFRLLSALAATDKPGIELEFSHRTLPYGYGKNFGFNRVIKLVSRPLWNVAAILEGAEGAVSRSGAEATAVQYLRWHCRQKVGHTRSVPGPRPSRQQPRRAAAASIALTPLNPPSSHRVARDAQVACGVVR